jgi:hypothetical protein
LPKLWHAKTQKGKTMLESLVQFHDHLPLLIRWSIDFIFQVIIIRGILANEIMSELRQRGILKQGIIHFVKQHIDKWTLIARKVAIVEHYRGGHNHDSVVGCGQGRCTLFA